MDKHSRNWNSMTFEDKQNLLIGTSLKQVGDPLNYVPAYWASLEFDKLPKDIIEELKNKGF